MAGKSVRARTVGLNQEKEFNVLLARMKWLKTSELAGRDGFPPSTLVTLYDQQSGETLHLIAKSGADEFASLKEFDEVEVELSFRKIDLASLGGTGKGKAYRLQLVGLTNGEAS